MSATDESGSASATTQPHGAGVPSAPDRRRGRRHVIGAMIGAFAAGRVADRIGRRATILITDGEQRTADAVPVVTAGVDPRS
jgi:hypothetical protein